MAGQTGSPTRARRADARLLHHVLDAPPQFGAPPQKKILLAGGLTRQPAQDRWHSFVGVLKRVWEGLGMTTPLRRFRSGVQQEAA
jgi:hypothetical protein